MGRIPSEEAGKIGRLNGETIHSYIRMKLAKIDYDHASKCQLAIFYTLHNLVESEFWQQIDEQYGDLWPIVNRMSPDLKWDIVDDLAYAIYRDAIDSGSGDKE